MRIWSAASCKLWQQPPVKFNPGRQQPQQTVIQSAEPVLGGGCCWRWEGTMIHRASRVHSPLLAVTPDTVIKTHSLSELSDPAFAPTAWPKSDPETKNWTAHKQTSEKMSVSSESHLGKRWDIAVRGVKQDRKVSRNISHPYGQTLDFSAVSYPKSGTACEGFSSRVSIRGYVVVGWDAVHFTTQTW